MCILRTLAKCFLAWLVFSCGMSYGQGTAREHYNGGMQYAAQGDFPAAKKEFQSALKLDPFDSDSSASLTIVNDSLEQRITSATAAHLSTAIALRNKNLFDQAKSEFVKIIEANPNYAPAYYHRGLTYERGGPPHAVLYDFDKALEINPNYAEAYYHRGLYYEDRAAAIRAISSYHVKLGRAYDGSRPLLERDREAERDYYQAISDYSEALKINPKLREVYKDRAFCYWELGEYDKAWDDVHQAEALGAKCDPQFVKALGHESRRER
jgi:Tfp pilus assembly protein PilF